MSKHRRRASNGTAHTNGDASTARELEILFPYEEFTLQNGTHVVVQQWSCGLGLRLTARLGRIVQRIRTNVAKPNFDMAEALEYGATEMAEIVRLTLGMDQATWDRTVSFEDFLDLTLVVFRRCIKREDDGAFPKVVKLVEELGPLLGPAGADQLSATASTS